MWRRKWNHKFVGRQIKCANNWNHFYNEDYNPPDNMCHCAKVPKTCVAVSGHLKPEPACHCARVSILGMCHCVRVPYLKQLVIFSHLCWQFVNNNPLHWIIGPVASCIVCKKVEQLLNVRWSTNALLFLGLPHTEQKVTDCKKEMKFFLTTMTMAVLLPEWVGKPEWQWWVFMLNAQRYRENREVLIFWYICVEGKILRGLNVDGATAGRDPAALESLHWPSWKLFCIRICFSIYIFTG